MTDRLSDEFLSKCTPRELPALYEGSNPEVHHLVGSLLTQEQAMLRCAHVLPDTPAIALKSIELSVGRTLPIYDHASAKFVETGRTRTIESSDRFEIAEGPTAASGVKLFVTVLKRLERR